MDTYNAGLITRQCEQDATLAAALAARDIEIQRQCEQDAALAATLAARDTQIQRQCEQDAALAATFANQDAATIQCESAARTPADLDSDVEDTPVEYEPEDEYIPYMSLDKQKALFDATKLKCVALIFTGIPPVGDICTICQDIFGGVIIKTTCNHMFCEGCIIDLIQRNNIARKLTHCPVCRKDMFVKENK
jgi:hypothetical protein